MVKLPPRLVKATAPLEVFLTGRAGLSGPGAEAAVLCAKSVKVGGTGIFRQSGWQAAGEESETGGGGGDLAGSTAKRSPSVQPPR